MTISLWRYSHLALAVSSFILLTLASVTGIILSFEPVAQKVQPYRNEKFNDVTLAQTIPVLRKQYPGISELSVDANQFVQVKGSDAQGKKLSAYVDPLTGKILGPVKPQSEFFQWVTTFHRSLFLHGLGRFFIGLSAFLLLLITISGTALVIQRQRGVKRFFKPIVKDTFAQYYHVVLSRWSLVPIILIAGSGTFLSLQQFGLIGDKDVQSPKVNFDAIKSVPVKKPADFAVFNEVRLSQVRSVEFPFSDDVEDYYILKLNDREQNVNQITGEILGEARYTTSAKLTALSLNIHTGRTSSLWAIILAVASVNIIFFIYSGFAITLKRRSGRTKNQYKAQDCEYIILTGSENGNTIPFAQVVHQQLLSAGKRSFVAELNSYQVFPSARQLIVLTATYGLGDAPANATRFASLIEKYPQDHDIQFSVLGFGSHSYPDFCKFAFEVHRLLSGQKWAIPLTDIHTVNDRSPEEFQLWTEAWSQGSGIQLDTSESISVSKEPILQDMTVTGVVELTAPDGVFSINLKPKRAGNVTSGDLLAIYPANDHRERLYSIGYINKEIRLSVRLHPGGLGSGFLQGLKPGDTIKAQIVRNQHFHFPKKASEVIMISNGTGIAPFLGMISKNKRLIPCHLYCGFRDELTYRMYRDVLDENQQAGRVQQMHLAFSREGAKQYVSHLVKNNGDYIGEALNRGGIMMICGSLSMQKDVMVCLETICQLSNLESASYYQSHGQILTDCY